MQQSELGRLTEGSSDNQVPIKGADPTLFEMMIRFHYTQDLPSVFEDKKDAVSLLKLADKYGVVNLKMLMEARIVESKVLSPESCVELLLLSESHNCALLREAAMNELVGNMQGIIAAGGLAELAQSPDLAKEVMICQANRGTSNKNNLGVSALRKRAAEKGLDVDGSRETLVKRLRAAGDAQDAASH